MAKAYLCSVADSARAARPADSYPVEHVRMCAALDTRGVHTLAPGPDQADVILFIEAHSDDSLSGAYFEAVRASPIYREYRSKCFVHSGMDRVVPLLPGIYPSIPRRQELRGWTRSGCYILPANPFLAAAAPARQPKRYLASFVGCTSGQPVRQQLTVLNEAAGFLVEDKTDAFLGAIRLGDDANVLRLKREYVEKAGASDFVLCPRGVGTSSIRMFEAMELGVAPVILSDEWVEPAGIDWSRCSIRVREADVGLLPGILASRRSQAQELGQAARRAWEQFFAPQSIFHTLVEDCLGLRAERRMPDTLLRLAAWSQFLQRPHLTRLARPRRLARAVRQLCHRTH